MDDNGKAQPEPATERTIQRTVELTEESRRGLDQVAMVRPAADAMSPQDAVAAAEPAVEPKAQDAKE